MYLELASLNLLFPHVVMKLHNLEYGVNDLADIWVLVVEELEHYADDLRLVEDYVARDLEH